MTMMEKTQIDQLAAAYVAEYLERGDAHSGAWDALESLAMHDPEAAWAVVERVVELPFPSTYLSWVGAGPLEELLRDHPRMFTKRALARARVDPRFREALQFARLNSDIEGLFEQELHLNREG
jgi:hypothetical protein